MKKANVKLNIKIVCFSIVLFLILIIGMFSFRDIKKDSENITFSGRWFLKEIDGQELQVTLNQGAMIYFWVEGTEVIDVYFRDLLKLDTPYFAYNIDEGDMVRQKITEKRINLPDKERHLITIVVDGMRPSEDKWNYENGVAFEKVDSHGGTIEKEIQDKKKVLFIGDSITEGVLSIGFVGNGEDNSATNSYTWHAAQQLDVEPYFLAYGGIGLSEKGSFTYAADVLDNFSSSRKAEDIPSADLIVFNIGSNDKDISDDDFIQEYRDVVLDLHDRYPGVNIICMIPINQNHDENIKNAVKDYEWCYVVDTSNWDINSYDGTHQIDGGCKVMADKLVEYIKNNNLLNNGR